MPPASAQRTGRPWGRASPRDPEQEQKAAEAGGVADEEDAESSGERAASSLDAHAAGEITKAPQDGGGEGKGCAGSEPDYQDEGG